MLFHHSRQGHNPTKGLQLPNGLQCLSRARGQREEGALFYLSRHLSRKIFIINCYSFEILQEMIGQLFAGILGRANICRQC